jgi:hypothetical protein
MWSTASVWKGDNCHCDTHILFYVDKNMWSQEHELGTKKDYIMERFKIPIFCMLLLGQLSQER